MPNFLNPCINVEVMAQTSFIYDYSFHHSSVTLTFKLSEYMFQYGTATTQGEQLCQIIFKSMHKCRSYGPYKSGWTSTRIHTKQNCNNYVLLTASELNKNSTFFSSPEPNSIGKLRRLSTISNFSSETTGPIATKFHIQPPGPSGKKSCSNSLGHMTTMAAMPIYGKNLKKYSSPEPIDQ